MTSGQGVEHSHQVGMEFTSMVNHVHKVRLRTYNHNALIRMPLVTIPNGLAPPVTMNAPSIVTGGSTTFIPSQLSPLAMSQPMTSSTLNVSFAVAAVKCFAKALQLAPGVLYVIYLLRNPQKAQKFKLGGCREMKYLQSAVEIVA
uniref:Transmembrane protein n=1 Tax=Heterorhabditis bacteriophora TaxID=37862 RepID=A0A1I7WNB4_HETBA